MPPSLADPVFVCLFIFLFFLFLRSGGAGGGSVFCLSNIAANLLRAGPHLIPFLHATKAPCTTLITKQMFNQYLLDCVKIWVTSYEAEIKFIAQQLSSTHYKAGIPNEILLKNFGAHLGGCWCSA